MKDILFWTVIASLILSNVLLVISILRPDRRFWPPPDTLNPSARLIELNGWRAPLTVIGVFALGIVDRGSVGPTYPALWWAGAVLFACGGAFALWGYFGLGVQASQGKHEGLVASGAYRYSRNPQYIGTIFCLFGYALVCQSILTFAAWLLWSAWFVMAPFAEEPWMRERLGHAFDDYAREVPRYIGRPGGRDRRQV